MLNYSTQQRHGQVRRQAQLYICWGSLTACLSLQFSRASVLLVADFSCSSWMRETFTAALSSSRLFSFSSVSCLSLEDGEGGGVQFKSNSNVMYVENTSIYNTLRGPIIPIHWNNKHTSWIRPFSHTTESHSSLDCQSTKDISPLVTDCRVSSLPSSPLHVVQLWPKASHHPDLVGGDGQILHGQSQLQILVLQISHRLLERQPHLPGRETEKTVVFTEVINTRFRSNAWRQLEGKLRKEEWADFPSKMADFQKIQKRCKSSNAQWNNISCL